MLPLDLHVLSLPLAFILSQDQTLHCKWVLILTIKILKKEKINESKSNFIRLTYLLCSFTITVKKRAVASKLSKNFWLHRHPFLKRECKCTSLFISTKIIFLIFNFLTSHQKKNCGVNLCKKRTCWLIFFADCKDTFSLHFQPKYITDFIHK